MTLRGCFWRGTAILATLVAFAACVALWPREAKAQAVCGKRADVVEMLAEEYDEYRIASAIIGKALLEVFASDTGTWTMHVLTPEGHACFLAQGEGWETFPAEPPKAPSHQL